MKHHIEIRGGHWIGVRGLLIVWLRALEDRIFGEIDAFAWVQGWEIDRRRVLRRVYRDPRFDALQECGLCRGEGTTAVKERCPLCDGTGRIDRGGSRTSGQGEPELDTDTDGWPVPEPSGPRAQKYGERQAREYGEWWV
ncbi:hypothetical protein Plo01_11250 [Planobispora longispora]|uniref:Uncharacterized protein n=1 Tax=Planobispora longispora TaxID=28887 RepID=A0A8J3REC7_9ACTN|nr:hypothetical protein Plo01_11250 [Planobispora longispora]